MNALRTPAITPVPLVKIAPQLHLVPAAPASVEQHQPCAPVDLIRINRLDRVIIADDSRRIACVVLFVSVFCWLTFAYEFLGIVS